MWQSSQVLTAVRLPPKRPPTFTGPCANWLADHSLKVRATGNWSSLLYPGLDWPRFPSLYVPSAWRSKIGLETSWQVAQRRDVVWKGDWRHSW